MPQPWDQQENEPKRSYVRFLLYRDLGPTRTVEAAYEKYFSEKKAGEGGEKLWVPGQWWRDSRAYGWSERAQAWDVFIFSKVGREAAVLLGHYVRELVTRGLKMLAHSSGPETWKEHLETINALCNVISPEVMSAIVQPGVTGAGRLRPASSRGPTSPGSGANVSTGGDDSGPVAGKRLEGNGLSPPPSPLWPANG
jgi:hypothetical protein